jgi:hypothetical protein
LCDVERNISEHDPAIEMDTDWLEERRKKDENLKTVSLKRNFEKARMNAKKTERKKTQINKELRKTVIRVQ